MKKVMKIVRNRFCMSNVLRCELNPIEERMITARLLQLPKDEKASQEIKVSFHVQQLKMHLFTMVFLVVIRLGLQQMTKTTTAAEIIPLTLPTLIAWEIILLPSREARKGRSLVVIFFLEITSFLLHLNLLNQMCTLDDQIDSGEKTAHHISERRFQLL